MVRTIKSAAWSLVLFFAAGFSSTVSAQELPKGEELMDKYVKATGGKEAYMKLKSQIVKATVSFKGRKGKILIYRKAPDLLYQEVRLPGLEPIRYGYNGKTAWEVHPISGARILDGAKVEELKRIADLQSDVNWRNYYKETETIKEEQIGGKDVYRVKLTTPMGAVQIRFFDKKTGLLVKKIDKIKQDTKEFDFVTEILDYKKVNGILIDSHARQTLRDQKTELHLDSAEFNVEIPEERFALPPEVKKKLKDV